MVLEPRLLNTWRINSVLNILNSFLNPINHLSRSPLISSHACDEYIIIQAFRATQGTTHTTRLTTLRDTSPDTRLPRVIEQRVRQQGKNAHFNQACCIFSDTFLVYE